MEKNKWSDKPVGKIKTGPQKDLDNKMRVKSNMPADRDCPTCGASYKGAECPMC